MNGYGPGFFTGATHSPQGNTIKGKPKRLYRVDVVAKIDPMKDAGTQHFTIALCLGLRGEIYWRVATYGEFITKRVPTNVLQLRRLLEAVDGDYGGRGLTFRIGGDWAMVQAGERYCGQCSVAELFAAVEAFLAEPMVQEHAGLFRVDVELVGPLDLVIMLDWDGEILVRLFRSADDQTTSEFPGRRYRITIGELMDFADGSRGIYIEPLHIYKMDHAFLVREGNHAKGSGMFKNAQAAARAFLDSPIVQEHVSYG